MIHTDALGDSDVQSEPRTTCAGGKPLSRELMALPGWAYADSISALLKACISPEFLKTPMSPQILPHFTIPPSLLRPFGPGSNAMIRTELRSSRLAFLLSFTAHSLDDPKQGSTFPSLGHHFQKLSTNYSNEAMHSWLDSDRHPASEVPGISVMPPSPPMPSSLLHCCSRELYECSAPRMSVARQ